jgi:phage terminase Nu1 subunit (DNA packaging protein)
MALDSVLRPHQRPAKSEAQGRLFLADRLALDQQELADAIGVSTRTLRTWMREEGLPFVRIRGVLLYSVAAVGEWLAARQESEEKLEQILDEIINT